MKSDFRLDSTYLQSICLSVCLPIHLSPYLISVLKSCYCHYFLSVVLGSKPRSSWVLAKCSTNGLHPQPLVKSLSIRKINQLENLITKYKILVLWCPNSLVDDCTFLKTPGPHTGPEAGVEPELSSCSDFLLAYAHFF